MADEREFMPREEEERKIPVFTVLKNGAILKNIFIVNNHPSSPPPPSPFPVSQNPVQNHEEILTVGRHPDCNITLTHPSISRFHLQIHSNPLKQHLSVVDLSSVHGTWVSENKAKPGVQVELEEGDTVRLGGSSRVYRLHWVPLNRAYDSENSFVPPMLDVCMTDEKEEENAVETYQDAKTLLIEEKNSLLVEGKEAEITQDENSFSTENGETQSQDLILDGLASLFSAENFELLEKKEIPSVPPLSENVIDDEEEEEEEEDEKEEEDEEDEEGEEDESLSEIIHEPREISSLWSRSIRPLEEVILETGSQQLKKESWSPKSYSVMEAYSETENAGSSSRASEQEFKLLVNIGSSFSILEEESTRLVVEVPEETENNISLEKDRLQRDFTGLSPRQVMTQRSPLPVEEVPAETSNQQINEESLSPQILLALQPETDGGKEDYCTEEQEVNLFGGLDAAYSVESHPASELLEAAECQSESSKDREEGEILGLFSVPIATDSVDPSLFAGEVLVTVFPEDTEQKTSENLQYAAAGLTEIELAQSSSPGSKKKPESSSIWSRRGKPVSAPQIQVGASRGKIVMSGTDAEVGSHYLEDTESNLISRALFNDLHDEEEIFTPNKDNFTPNTLLVKSLRRKGVIGEIGHPKSCMSSSSKNNSSPGTHPEDMSAFSDKENLAPKVLHEHKSGRRTYRNQVMSEQEITPIKRVPERVPFQSLLVNSKGKSRADAAVPDAALRSCNSVTCAQNQKVTNISSNNSTGEAKRIWTMVVDTTTLLSKESRKSLHLLQGLKGTRLFIPRMVVRELDCLKRRGSLFRKTTEASLVLEWIEECMVKTKWWIHVQSSFEEERAIAPTPPAFPQSLYSEGIVGSSYGTASSAPFSSYGNLTEIVSPTAEDHIIDCALLYRKQKDDGRLVLLSDDITLKIKAMAEGLICETAQEFRESLVNPCSERFLWAESSPRGLTWSCLDDVVLREQYSRHPLKKSTRGESAKGLKLILLHKFHYGQIR